MYRVELSHVHFHYPPHPLAAEASARIAWRAGRNAWRRLRGQSPEGGTPVQAILDDVSLEIRGPGIVGIIGRNGAGKSTLLQLMAGILRPQAGRIDVVGRMSNILAIGCGMMLDLSGWENIALVGVLMGVPERVMRAHAVSIARFAEVEAACHLPVRCFSSGMKARLAFAIQTAVPADILLVDELLEVGDESFRKRSRDRLAEVAAASGLVLIVTHRLPYLRNYAKRVIWIEGGKVCGDGPPREVVPLYRETLAPAA